MNKILIERYIAKAGEQETRLEEMDKQRKAMEAVRGCKTNLLWRSGILR